MTKTTIRKLLFGSINFRLMYTYTMAPLYFFDILLSRDPVSSMFLTKFKVLCCTLFLGMIITGFMKEDNRRQAADQERANSIVTSQLLESKSNREDFSEKI